MEACALGDLAQPGDYFCKYCSGRSLYFQKCKLFYWATERLDELGRWMDGRIGRVCGNRFYWCTRLFLFVQRICRIYWAFSGRCPGCSTRQTLPEAEWIKPPRVIESSIASLRFILWSLFVYIIASPILLIGYFIPPIGLVLQFLLGGYLLSREFAHLIELRLPRNKRIKKPGSLWHGTLAIFLWTLPLINLLPHYY